MQYMRLFADSKKWTSKKKYLYRRIINGYSLFDFYLLIATVLEMNIQEKIVVIHIVLPTFLFKNFKENLPPNYKKLPCKMNKLKFPTLITRTSKWAWPIKLSHVHGHFCRYRDIFTCRFCYFRSYDFDNI